METSHHGAGLPENIMVGTSYGCVNSALKNGQKKSGSCQSQIFAGRNPSTILRRLFFEYLEYRDNNRDIMRENNEVLGIRCVAP